MSQRRLAIIIVHHKTPDMLADCLASLQPQLDASRDQIIIIDNASGQPALSTLRNLSAHYSAHLIESPQNLGFAAANNQAIQYMRNSGNAQYILLLNPDTILRPHALATLRDFLESHTQAGAVGPRLEYPDGTPQLSAFGDPSPLSELIRGANIGPLARLLKRWQVYGEIQNTSHSTGWLAGACVLLRSALLEKTGLLDGRFFMYFEEVDFFRRARRRGFEIWYQPAARVVHLVGQASGVTTKWSARRLPSYWFESRHHYFRKHFGYTGMLAADACWFTGHTLMRLRRAFTGTSHSAIARSEPSDLLRHSLRQLLRPGAGGAT